MKEYEFLVYLSYRGVDDKLAEKISYELKKLIQKYKDNIGRKINWTDDIFMDKDILKAGDISHQINMHVASSKYLLLIYTENTHIGKGDKSIDYVEQELKQFAKSQSCANNILIMSFSKKHDDANKYVNSILGTSEDRLVIFLDYLNMRKSLRNIENSSAILSTILECDRKKLHNRFKKKRIINFFISGCTLFIMMSAMIFSYIYYQMQQEEMKRVEAHDNATKSLIQLEDKNFYDSLRFAKKMIEAYEDDFTKSTLIEVIDNCKLFFQYEHINADKLYLSHSGKYIATIGVNAGVKVVNIEEYNEIELEDSNIIEDGFIEFNYDDSLLLFFDLNGKVVLWELDSGKVFDLNKIVRLNYPNTKIEHCNFIDENKLIIYTEYDELYLFDWIDKTTVDFSKAVLKDSLTPRKLDTHDDFIMFTGSRLSLYNCNSGEITLLEGFEENLSFYEFIAKGYETCEFWDLEGGKLLVSGTSDYRIWDVNTGGILIKGSEVNIKYMELSADGNFLAIYANNNLKVLELETGKELFLKNVGSVQDVEFVDQVIIISDDNGYVRIYDIESEFEIDSSLSNHKIVDFYIYENGNIVILTDQGKVFVLESLFYSRSKLNEGERGAYLVLDKQYFLSGDTIYSTSIEGKEAPSVYVQIHNDFELNGTFSQGFIFSNDYEMLIVNVEDGSEYKLRFDKAIKNQFLINSNKEILVVFEDGNILIENLQSKLVLDDYFVEHLYNAESIRLTDCNKFMIFESEKRVMLYDLKNHSFKVDWEANFQDRKFVFDEETDVIYQLSYDYSVEKIYDDVSMSILSPRGNQIKDFCISRQCIYVGFTDGSVKCYNKNDFTISNSVKLHDSPISALFISNDKLISISEDKNVKISDLKSLESTYTSDIYDMSIPSEYARVYGKLTDEYLLLGFDEKIILHKLFSFDDQKNELDKRIEVLEKTFRLKGSETSE